MRTTAVVFGCTVDGPTNGRLDADQHDPSERATAEAGNAVHQHRRSTAASCGRSQRRATRRRSGSTPVGWLPPNNHSPTERPELCSPTMASLMRVANASIVNGLIIICMPGSRYPLRMTAFSA
jgi:hypothetical protein